MQTGLGQAVAEIEAFNRRIEGLLSKDLSVQIDTQAAQRSVTELERATRSQVQTVVDATQQIAQAQESIPPLTLDVDTLVAQLQQSGGEIGDFLRGVAEGVTEELAAMEAEFGRAADSGTQLTPSVSSITQAMGLGASGSERFAQGLRTLAQQQEVTAQTALRTATASRDLVAGMTQAGRAAVEAAAGTRAWAAGMGELQRQAQAAASVTQAVNPMAVAMASGQRGSARFAEGLRNLKLAEDAAAVSAERLANASRNMVAGMSAAGKAAFDANAGTRAWAQGMANLRAQSQAASGAFTASTKGISRLQAGLTGIAISSSGANAAVGQIVSGLLLLGPGSTAVIGAAAGIALVAGAIELIEGPARRARKAADDLLESLRQAERSRLSPFDQMTLQLGELQGESDKAAARIRQLQVQIAAQGKGGALLFPELPREIARLEEIRRQMGLIEGLRAQAKVEAGEELIRGLENQVAAFGRTSAEVQKLAILMDQSLTPAQRRDALAIADNLIQLERQQKRLEEIEKIFERIGFVVPPLFLDLPDLELKPRIDLSQIEGSLSRLQADFQRGRADDSLQKEFERAADAAKLLEFELARINLSLKDIGNAEVDFGGAEDLAAQIADVNRGLDALVGAAANIGLIDEATLRAVQSMQDLADSIGTVITEGATAGNVLGLVGAGLNVLGSLFGGSESERERIVRENTRAIEEATSAYRAATQGVGGQQGVVDAINSILQNAENRFLLIASGAPGSIGGQAQSLLEEQLSSFGLSLADLDRIARDHGIQLLDEDGRIVSEAFRQLAEITEILIQDQLRFRNTFEDQLQFLELRGRISGEAQDPRSAFERQIEAIGRIDSQIDEMFAGVDLGNEEAVRQIALGLLDQFEQGLITPEQLGELSREDFLRFLEFAAGYLDSFNEEVQSTTDALKQLNNVPGGFKLARAEFLASDFGPDTGPTRFDQALPWDGSRLPGFPASRSSSLTVHPGAIVIQAAAGQSADAIADAVLQALERKAMRQTGDTLQAGFR